eukprot:14054372-Alexandrium_andersonii.AAC.1
MTTPARPPLRGDGHHAKRPKPKHQGCVETTQSGTPTREEGGRPPHGRVAATRRAPAQAPAPTKRRRGNS